MNKRINLSKARDLAYSVLASHGEDYRSRVLSGWELPGKLVNGCVNVVAVKNGQRWVPNNCTLGRNENGSQVARTVENYAKAGYDLQPGCLIGTMLIEGNYLTIEDFVDACTIGSQITSVADIHEIPVTGSAMIWMRAAQEHQDKGNTWGAAVAHADKIVLDRMGNGLIDLTSL